MALGLHIGPRSLRVGPAVGARQDGATPSVPPVYEAAGVAASGTGALTPGIPAGTAANDILLLWVGNGHTTTTAATLTDAQGFAGVTGGAIDSGSYTGIHHYGTLFWKRATGSDAAPTVADNGESNYARIYRFSGVTTTGNPWDVVSSTGDNTADSSISLTGVTTTTNNCLIVHFVGCYTNSTATVGSWTNANLTSLTERDDASYNPGVDEAMAMATGVMATAGATGATTATWSVGTLWIWSGVMIALKPA